MAHQHGAASSVPNTLHNAELIAGAHEVGGLKTMVDAAKPMMTMAHAANAACPLAAAEAAGTLGTAAAAAGTTAALTTTTGRSLMHRVLKHPLVWFSLGLSAGYFAHKYRKEIIASALRASEQGKDFMLQRKESLEDLIAESKERAEDSGSASG